LRVGVTGEQIAGWRLSERGFEVVDRNVVVADGEVDLVVVDGARAPMVVEVRTVTSQHDPIDAVPAQKRERVRALASKLGTSRVGFVGVGLRSWGVEIHYLPC
jgi:Holliday junction resolvase-like predicted endonuclease